MQAVWAGYGGLRIREQGLELNHPSPPPDATALVLHNVAFRGGALCVDINRTHVAVTLLRAGAKASILRSEDSADPVLQLNVPFVVRSAQVLLVFCSGGRN